MLAPETLPSFAPGDGDDTGDNPSADLRRDTWLRGQGVVVLRFNAGDVMKDVDSIVAAILVAARR